MQATSNEQRAQNKTQTNTRLDYGTHNNKCSGRLGHLAFSTPRVLLSPRGQGKSISAKNVLKMSLECLAIIGSKNDPLYLTATDDTSSKETSSVETEDAFGFLSETADGGKEAGKPSIRHEFMMHAALDRLEEILGKVTDVNYSRFQRGSHWLGSVLSMEDCEIYGYVTVSDVKILALIKRENIIPLKRRKENDIKALFIAVHDCYVKYTMNPFTKIRSKVQNPCGQFEKGVHQAIKTYREAVIREHQSELRKEGSIVL